VDNWAQLECSKFSIVIVIAIKTINILSSYEPSESLVGLVTQGLDSVADIQISYKHFS
jgi:hypothetical protein